MHPCVSSYSGVNRNTCIAGVNWTVVSSQKIDRNPWHFLAKVNTEEECKASCIGYPGCRSAVWSSSTGKCSLHSITRLEARFDYVQTTSDALYFEYHFTPLCMQLYIAVIITMTSYEWYVISNYWSRDGLFNNLRMLTEKISKVRIYRRPVATPHKGSVIRKAFMMTSSNGNIFRVTGHLCGKFTGPR